MRILHVGDDFAALRPCGLTLYSDALMRAQAAAGHEVSYLFSGRHYPGLERPRLKRWNYYTVRMIELIGSPNNSHWELGTRYPERDVEEPFGEVAFDAAVRDSRPEVIHIQELAGLPSSLIERAKTRGIPVVMTVHDYKTVCASVRLLDADGRRCMRLDVGEDCARNCAGAPAGHEHLIEATLDFQTARLANALPLAGDEFQSRTKRVIKRLAHTDVATGHAAAASSPAAYQRRRDVNVEQLGLCDRLIAPSKRVAEIYGELGVDRRRLVVQRLTLPHLERLTPGAGSGRPLTFVTLGGCASESKGSHVVVEAVETLERAGRGGDYRLLVLGQVQPAVREALADVAAVELAGPYEPSQLDGLLEDAHVGIMPSIWEEVHGFVGIEMLAKGLPLIASALGGIPEYVIEGETGWLSHSATGAELAELMAAALDDPAAVERLRRSVRERRSEIVRPMQDHVDEVDALYREVAGTAPAAAA